METIDAHTPERGNSAFYLDALRTAQTGDVRQVVALIDSPDVLVRREAVKQIRKRRLVDAAPRLERLVAEDDELKLTAMLALEKLALPSSRALFLRELQDERLRLAALRGLLEIGAPEAVAGGEEVYRTGGDTVTREVALYVLARAGADDVLRRLLDEEPSWRWRRKIRKAIRKAERMD